MSDRASLSATFDELYEQFMAVAPMRSSDPASAIVELRRLAAVVEHAQITELERGYLYFSCSSQLLNCAPTTADREAIQFGRDLAERALERAEPDGPQAWECRYNIANSLLEECDLDWPDTSGDASEWEPEFIEMRLKHSNVLREARAMLFKISEAENAQDRTRSASCCNLANALDTSGRWAEAYDWYLRALEISPDNGNAAGNLAQLLQVRIESGIGQTGHLATVYDHYLSLAQAAREGTIRFAGDDVADHWDALMPTGSLGHFAHEPGEDPYHQWVAQHRLALSPAVEGLGTDDSRWDTATISTLFSSIDDPSTPAILGEMNVLKADFLVSRRLAFGAITDIAEHALAQPESDTGYYVDTEDFALYGTSYSMLLLAQRSTLDVLDKTAVAANDHFECGDRPDRVSFRKFWTDNTGALRADLVRGPGRARPVLAIAELAVDMAEGGMYADSQALRNAGTHRIVHAALLDATGVTRLSRSSIDVLRLIESTLLALQVTRSAYLYLIDLVAMWNRPEDRAGEWIELRTPEYSPRSSQSAADDDPA
jgi:tetratricopeptide (TPR) repeat protein